MVEQNHHRAGYALGAVVRLTGLSEHVLRAWERRYRAVTPERTPGGTRRYSETHVRRLQLLHQAVEAGHTISEIAQLPDEALVHLVEELRPKERSLRDEVLDALERLDGAEVERLLGIQFSVLGPRTFALDVVLPLLREIGDRWERGLCPVAVEHVASAITRSILGVALRGRSDNGGAPILFATPAGERHEFGCLIGALLTLGAGVDPVYLGPDTPAEDVCLAAERIGARAVVLGILMWDQAGLAAYLHDVRRTLPLDVAVWIGGPQGSDLDLPSGVEFLSRLQDLERRVRTLPRPAP